MVSYIVVKDGIMMTLFQFQNRILQTIIERYWVKVIYHKSKLIENKLVEQK